MLNLEVRRSDGASASRGTPSSHVLPRPVACITFCRARCRLRDTCIGLVANQLHLRLRRTAQVAVSSALTRVCTIIARTVPFPSAFKTRGDGVCDRYAARLPPGCCCGRSFLASARGRHGTPARRLRRRPGSCGILSERTRASARRATRVGRRPRSLPWAWRFGIGGCPAARLLFALPLAGPPRTVRLGADSAGVRGAPAV